MLADEQCPDYYNVAKYLLSLKQNGNYYYYFF